MLFKLVRKSLEPQHFQRGLDPKHAMGIGKYAIIKDWLKKMEIENFTINDDYTIDVDKGVDLHEKNLDKFPDYIQFGKVDGYFDCSHNELTSLRGAPKHVNGSFYCSYNQLTSLEGAPKYIEGNFWCYNNTKQFTKEEVRSVCNVKRDIYVCLNLFENRFSLFSFKEV